MICSSSSAHYGFTLIELMVVIVIIGITASLVVMNLNGIDQRKAMQAREVFLLDLQKINREANDQARILALETRSATDVNTFVYNLLEYQTATDMKTTTGFLAPAPEKWQKYSEFPSRHLPPNVSFSIQPLGHDFQNASNEELLGSRAPKLIWLGNGEVRPVRIQFYLEQRPVGHEIEIDYLGKISET